MFSTVFSDQHSGFIARVAKLSDATYFLIVQNPAGVVKQNKAYSSIESILDALKEFSDSWTEMPLMCVNLVSVEEKNICQCSACSQSIFVERTTDDRAEVRKLLSGVLHYCPYCGRAYAGAMINGVALTDWDEEAQHKWVNHHIGDMRDFVVE